MKKEQIDFLKFLRGNSFMICQPPKHSCSWSVGGKMVKDTDLAQLAQEFESLGYVTSITYKLGKEDYIRYNLTVAGRVAAREQNQTLTLDVARTLPDSTLEQVWGDHLIAQQVLNGRGKAAQQIRLVLARTYGKDGCATHSVWHIIPCLTDKNTIGILNIAEGCAWDTGIVADDGVHDLGTEEEVCGSANGIAGNCYIDNTLVQSDGVAVKDGQKVTLNMPIGWKQIALPTWRGYKPDINRYTDVPEELFKPEHWIRPTLVACHLMTCYGRPGTRDGTWLSETTGIHAANFPWGVPPWIKGTSTSIFNVLVKTAQDLGCFYELEITNAPRDSDEEELKFLWAMYQEMQKELSSRLVKVAQSTTVKKLKGALMEGSVALMQNSTLPPAIDSAIIRIRNDHNGCISPRIPDLCFWRAAHNALKKGLPHEAATYLARVGVSFQ